MERGKTRTAWRIASGSAFLFLLVMLVVASRTPASTITRGKPFVVTESLRADNGAMIPAGTEVLIEGEPSTGTMSVTLHLFATPETVSTKFRPITEKRDYLVLSYWVGRP